MLYLMHMKGQDFWFFPPLVGCVLFLKMLAIDSESKGVSCFWVLLLSVK